MTAKSRYRPKRPGDQPTDHVAILASGVGKLPVPSDAASVLRVCAARPGRAAQGALIGAAGVQPHHARQRPVQVRGRCCATGVKPQASGANASDAGGDVPASHPQGCARDLSARCGALVRPCSALFGPVGPVWPCPWGPRGSGVSPATKPSRWSARCRKAARLPPSRASANSAPLTPTAAAPRAQILGTASKVTPPVGMMATSGSGPRSSRR